MSKKVALIPPDRKRCQAEIREGSFMTLGPRRIKRCDNKPTVIAKENKPGSDGRCGSMSLCDECLNAMVRQLGAAACTLTLINPKKGKKK